MIVERPALEAGQQEIAIMIDAATGWPARSPRAPRSTSSPPSTVTNGPAPRPVEDHRVQRQGHRRRPAHGFGGRDDRARTEAVPITFALGTLDAQRLAFAESFAQNVRLALVAPGSDALLTPEERTYDITKDK